MIYTNRLMYYLYVIAGINVYSFVFIKQIKACHMASVGESLT